MNAENAERERVLSFCRTYGLGFEKAVDRAAYVVRNLRNGREVEGTAVLEDPQRALRMLEYSDGVADVQATRQRLEDLGYPVYLRMDTGAPEAWNPENGKRCPLEVAQRDLSLAIAVLADDAPPVSAAAELAPPAPGSVSIAEPEEQDEYQAAAARQAEELADAVEGLSAVDLAATWLATLQPTGTVQDTLRTLPAFFLHLDARLDRIERALGLAGTEGAAPAARDLGVGLSAADLEGL